MIERAEYLRRFKEKHDLPQILGILEGFKDLKVLVIGDVILDQYVFVRPKGRAVKDPILSTSHIYDEIYGGGVIAIANHLSDFVSAVSLVTIVGEKNPKLDIIKGSLRPNLDLKFFVKKGAPTNVKKRFIDIMRNNKLFKIEYMDDAPLDMSLSEEICAFLKEAIPKHDLVVVGDFGHGFINEDMRRVLESESKFLAFNAQSNSSNMGYNYFTLYKKADFFSSNEEELRLPLSMRFDPIDDVINKVSGDLNRDSFLVTQSKRGCTFVKNGQKFSSPSLTSSVTDTVGAGDALFAISLLFAYAKADDELVPFIANCAGGIAANIVGNKDSVTMDKLESFVREVLK